MKLAREGVLPGTYKERPSHRRRGNLIETLYERYLGAGVYLGR
jgi:hypothetical protein